MYEMTPYIIVFLGGMASIFSPKDEYALAKVYRSESSIVYNKDLSEEGIKQGKKLYSKNINEDPKITTLGQQEIYKKYEKNINYYIYLNL